MPTNIYVWKRKSKSERQAGTGTLKKEYLTSREVKQYIMKVNNWTSADYQKQYDIFKNKLRAYESYQQAQGAKVKKQSPVEVLYKEARDKQLYGASYKPSQKMEQIKSFSAYSITKGRQVTKSLRYQEKQSKAYGQYIRSRFGSVKSKSGLIYQNEGAKKIYNAFVADARKKGEPVNYAKMEEALTDYANKLGAKYTPTGEAVTPNTMPNGETYGSDEQIDFDIEEYL